MDYLKMNGLSIPYPNNFTMQRKLNKVAEINTMSGDDIADVNGWKYEPQTFQWDTLLDQDLNNLLSIPKYEAFDMVFWDIDGEHTEKAVFESRVNVKTPLKRNGQIVWSDVQVAVSFPKCHHD